MMSSIWSSARGFSIFDITPARLADETARLDEIGRLLHERERNPLDAEVETEGQVGAILLGQGRQVEARCWAG